jgi:hypothetical protein
VCIGQLVITVDAKTVCIGQLVITVDAKTICIGQLVITVDAKTVCIGQLVITVDAKTICIGQLVSNQSYQCAGIREINHIQFSVTPRVCHEVFKFIPTMKLSAGLKCS